MKTKTAKYPAHGRAACAAFATGLLLGAWACPSCAVEDTPAGTLEEIRRAPATKTYTKAEVVQLLKTLGVDADAKPAPTPPRQAPAAVAKAAKAPAPDEGSEDFRLAQQEIRKPEKTVSPLWGVLVRRTYQDVTLDEDPTLDDKAKGSYRDAAGALVSYTRDFRTRGNIAAVEAAFLRPFVRHTDFTPRSDNFGVAAYGIVPSVSINRRINTADQKDGVDELAFRAGAHAVLAGGPFDLLEARLIGTYGTDTSFHSRVPRGEFELEPTFLKLGFGALHGVPGISNDHLLFRLRGFVHSEFGRVTDREQPSGGPKVQGDYGWVGPVAKLTLSPLFSSRVTFNGSIAYYQEFSGHVGSRRLYDATLDYQLDKEGHLALSLAFEEGQAPFRDQEVKSLTLGFSAKY